MRHIISILLQNESGALARVAGLFSSRGYNIESLSVAATDDPAVSRLTLVTTGTDQVINQINKQISKLHNTNKSLNVIESLGAPHFDKQNEGGVRSTLLTL